MKRKCLAVGIILLFIGACIIPAIAQNTEKSQSTSRGNWLYVGGSGPGNYTRIQDAIDNASDGNTVYVYDDASPYIEAIGINKKISLLGENKNTTVIQSPLFHDCITINVDNVTIRNFTIIDTEGSGIFIRSNHNRIQENVFKRIEINSWCVMCEGCDNIISNNFFIAGGACYIEVGSDRNIICDNYFGDGEYDAIIISPGNFNIIKNNNIGLVETGIYFGPSCCHNIVTENNFDPSSPLDIHFSQNCHVNTIYHNNFSSNSKVSDYGWANIWQEGYPSGGNYWRDYQYEDKYSGANQDEPGSDGIGDKSVFIQGGNNSDHLPLMIPYGTTKLTIEYHQKLFNRSIIIKNVGNTTAFVIQWNMTINGGILFSSNIASGYIPKSLRPNDEYTISFNDKLFGFGMIEINVTIWAENTHSVTEKINGILFLFFFIALRK